MVTHWLLKWPHHIHIILLEMHQSLFLHKEAELEVWEKIDTIRDRINRFANPYLITFGSIYHEQHVRDPLGLFSVPMFRSKMKDRMRLKMESIMENLKTAKSEAEKSFLEDQLRSTQVFGFKWIHIHLFIFQWFHTDFFQVLILIDHYVFFVLEEFLYISQFLNSAIFHW